MNSEAHSTMSTSTSGETHGAGGPGEGSTSSLSSTASSGRKVADKIQGAQEGAAQRADAASDRLHEDSDSLPGGPKVARAAHAAADSLTKTAKYIRENDMASVAKDVKRLVKDNPVPALLGAAAIGFVLARMFSRD